MLNYCRIILLALICLPLLISAQKNEFVKKAEDALWEEDNPKKALSILEGVELDSANRADGNFVKAMALLQNQQHEDAFGQFRELSTDYPEDFRGYFGQGLVFMEVGQIENCIITMTNALELAPHDSLKAMIRFNRSSCYSMAQQNDLAMEDLEFAHAYDTTDLDYMNNLAMHCDKVGQMERGLKIMRKIVEIDPTYPGAYTNLGFQLSQLERYEEAEQAFLKGMELYPESPYILNNLGYVVFKLGRSKEARKLIKKSLKQMENNAYAYRNLALIDLHEKEYDAACENLKMALNLNFTILYGDEVKNLYQENCLSKD